MLQRIGPSVVHLRLLWDRRKLHRSLLPYGLLASTLIAFLIPVRFKSTARLMPPENHQTGGLAAAAAALSGSAGGLAGLGGLAPDGVGVKRTMDLFFLLLSSATRPDKTISQFHAEK